MDFEVALGEISEEDLPQLTQAMTTAFDDDTKTYLGRDKGGPPGYDDGEFFRRWLFSYDECLGYKILIEGRIVGGILVWLSDDRNYTWGTVFVDPAWQNRGICTRAWTIVEGLHPEAKTWTLETPSYSRKNHRVYEKLGFVKVKEVDTADHPGKSFVFQKTMDADSD